MGHDECSSNSSHDRHGHKKPKVKGDKNYAGVVGGCCFWLRILPPMKWILGFWKWVFLSKYEYDIIKAARKLFKTVNVDHGCCADCPYAQLSDIERMYLHRVLQDEQRWGQAEYNRFVGSFRGHLKAYQADTSDGGTAITEGEFCAAVLTAVQEYMQRLVEKMREEIKKEYEKDGKEAGVAIKSGD
jgi:hypothetical protein